MNDVKVITPEAINEIVNDLAATQLYRRPALGRTGQQGDPQYTMLDRKTAGFCSDITLINLPSQAQLDTETARYISSTFGKDAIFADYLNYSGAELIARHRTQLESSRQAALNEHTLFERDRRHHTDAHAWD